MFVINNAAAIHGTSETSGNGGLIPCLSSAEIYMKTRILL